MYHLKNPPGPLLIVIMHGCPRSSRAHNQAACSSWESTALGTMQTRLQTSKPQTALRQPLGRQQPVKKRMRRLRRTMQLQTPAAAAAADMTVRPAVQAGHAVMTTASSRTTGARRCSTWRRALTWRQVCRTHNYSQPSMQRICVGAIFGTWQRQCAS